MWKFAPASDSDGHPLLRSLNNNIGRQVWVYDPNAGTSEERKAVEEAQAKFTANRFTQKDSADELLRCVFNWVLINNAR
jgi:cycloartenol synthase